jgi:uncharacterized membrane protein
VSKVRLEAFSDGVFAIVVTLLVLEIHVPQLPHAHTSADLWAAVAALAPKVGTWALSFVFALIYWVNHHGLLASVARVDRVILFLNGLFLLALSFLPFPTALLGEYPREAPAVVVFGVSMVVIGAAFFLLRRVAARRGLLPHVPDAARRSAEIRGALGPALYLLGAVAGLVDTRLAWAVFLLIPVLYLGASAAERHGAAEGGSQRAVD